MTAAAKPSRFHATPAEIDAFLREHFAEDVLLRYQWAVGDAAAHEAAEDIRAEASAPDLIVKSRAGNGPIQNGLLHGADWIDPALDGGPYPSKLVDFQQQHTDRVRRMADAATPTSKEQ